MDLNRAAALIHRKRQEIKSLEAEISDIWEQFQFESEADIPAGKFVVQVRRTKRFDAATAKRNLTAERLAAIMATKPDSALAKKNLSDEEYAACQRLYDYTKTVVPVEDEEV